jgi:elongation factor P--(R)-beta-lysine ligase
MTGPAPEAMLRLRSSVLQAVRGFFTERGFIEVETPVRIPAPAQEEHIDAEPSGEWFLRSSPELQMKRLLAAGNPRIFQVGPCFRMGERGARHNPEFTLLEWYRSGAGYVDAMADAKALLAHVCRRVLGSTDIRRRGRTLAMMPLWEVVTVRDAFLEFAGWDPMLRFDADRFDLDLVEKVEPALDRDHPVILEDYPPECAALARCRPDDPPCAERWELYVAGMELANAFGELTDAAEQRARFDRAAAARRLAGKTVFPTDEDFLAALSAGMPPSCGVALGMDRLVMLLGDVYDIEAVRGFCS